MKIFTAMLAFAGCALTSSALAADIDWSQLPPAAKTNGVTFDKDISPLMKASCVRCHSGDRPKAGLRLDSLDGVMKGTKKGAVVVAGDSANSLLVKSVSQLDPEIAMPPKPRPHRGPGGDGQPPGTNAPAMDHPDGPPPPHFRGGDEPHGPDADHTPGAVEGTNTPPMRPHNFGPPAKPLTAEQVGLIRAWIDQGAK